MTQKTIKALYKQPVNYKLTKDGYKTINGVIQAQDGMPKVVDLPVPSELYTTDLQYNVNAEVNGAPIITTEQFTLPDNEICEAKQYCYAPKGIDYNYTAKQNVRHYDNFTVVGSPTITSAGIVSGFSVNDRLQLVNMPTYSAGTITSFEFMFKIHTPETFTPNGRLLNDFNSYDDVKLEVFSTGIAFNYGTSSTYIYNSSLSISTNTDYWIRVIYNNGIMSLDYSTDGINYSVAASAEIASSNIQILSSTFDIGARYYGNQDPGCTWAGAIDLSETYIKINGEYYWLPYREVTEEVITQIPGILDSSVITDNWQQSQEYKLYQLKNQNNTDSLQLTENSITDTTQKYKQYINQLTIPARDYKWYYNGIPQSRYANFWSYGAIIENEIGIDFTGGPIEVYPLNYMGHDSDIVTAIFNIETGDITTDCVFFDMYSNYEEEASVLFAIRNSKFSYNAYTDPTQIIYGDTILSSNTKYWVALSLNKTQMKLELYLIQDNNYNKEQLPDISQWLKQFEYSITNPETIYAYSYIGASTSSSISIAHFNGKVYLNNMFATGDLTTSYEYLCWESYSYSNFIYAWYANKSLYNYIENETCADILDFTDSWLNVTNNWRTQKKYVNSKVCLMPIDSGETVTTYVQNGNLVGNVIFNKYTGELNNFSTNNYVTLPAIFDPSNNSWEMIFKFNSGTIGTSKGIFAIDTYYSLVLGFKNKLCIWTSSDGSTWSSPDMDDNGLTTLSNNIDYYVKATYSNNTLTVYLSTDKTTWTTEYTQSISLAAVSSNFSKLGLYRAGGSPLDTGSIDLKECQIKVNDNIWWSGTSIKSIENNKYLIPIEEQTDYTNFNNLPTTFIDGSNFEIYNNTIRNGSKSYHVSSGYSYGYIELTPDPQHSNISFSVSVSSESGWDTGAIYIGTQLYKPAYDVIKTSGVTDGHGEWLFRISGSTSNTYSYRLTPGVKYYIQFYYAKDGGGDGNDDRFWINAINNLVGLKTEINSISGCLYDYNDEGQEHQFDVYHDANYTQPILVSAGESYSEGTKVDTITIPAHKTWNYQTGGNWEKLTYIDVSNSMYTYENGNLTLTYYTGNETDVTLPNIDSEE